jgi:hypothetical protein
MGQKTTVLHEDDEGRFYAKGNEDDIQSKVDDPAARRLTSPITKTGGGGGKVSFNALRADGGVEELGFLIVRQSEDVRGQRTNYTGECMLFLRDEAAIGNDDAKMVKMVRITPAGVELNPLLLKNMKLFDAVLRSNDVPIVNPTDAHGEHEPATPPPPPAPSGPPLGPYGIPVGDTEAVTAHYGFAPDAGDIEQYHKGAMTWDVFIARMDRRAS